MVKIQLMLPSLNNVIKIFGEDHIVQEIILLQESLIVLIIGRLVYEIFLSILSYVLGFLYSVFWSTTSIEVVD